MLKILERSHGTLDIAYKNNKLKKIYQSGCSKILIPNSYNENNELVAVAKLSVPVLKSFDTETLIKVKLDF